MRVELRSTAQLVGTVDELYELPQGLALDVRRAEPRDAETVLLLYDDRTIAVGRQGARASSSSRRPTGCSSDEINVVTIFPGLLHGAAGAQHPGARRGGGQVHVSTSSICATTRTTGIARSTTTPYGGGPGMVMKPGPFFEAVERSAPTAPIVLMSAARPPLRAGRRGALRRGRGAHAPLRPLQGRRPARRRSPRDRGAVARRLRAERRRAGGARDDRRDGATAARRDERSRKRVRRFVLDARIIGAELHAARRISRIHRAGRAALGRSRADRAVARG